jgi:hypothetical protein
MLPLNFRLRPVFGTKTFEILAENVIFFGPNSPKFGCASEYRVTFLVDRKKSQKKVEWSVGHLHFFLETKNKKNRDPN